MKNLLGKKVHFFYSRFSEFKVNITLYFFKKIDSLQGDRNPFELLRDGLVFHILRYLTPQELCSLCQGQFFFLRLLK